MKTRKMKRFATIAAIAMIASCVAMPMAAMTASAAETANITMMEGTTVSENSVYVAYKLLNLSTSGSGEDINYAYTVNDDYRAVLQKITGETEDEDIIKAIEDVTDVQAFANKVYTMVKDMEVDATSNKGVFANMAQGYYLIAETTLSSDADTYSLVMLDTNGGQNIPVKTKESTPSLIKKVKDINDSEDEEKSEWQDSADHDITDAVDFQLTGTVSSKYDEYKEYYYVFHDECCDGLTVDTENLKVYLVNGATKTLIENTETDKYYEVIEAPTDDCTFEVRFADLKKVSGVTGTSQIVVEYTAVLNDNAVLGSAGNPNEAYLEYSNNPYFVGNGVDADNDGKDDGSVHENLKDGVDNDGDGQIDEDDEYKDGIDNDGDGQIDEEDEGKGDEEESSSNSPVDKVIVFTYKTVINKTDENGDPLTGATFTLEKYNKVKDTWEAIDQVETGSTATFTFKGLDDGNYRLTEEASPAGYTKLSAPIEFTVAATHGQDTDEKPLELTALTGTATSGEITLAADLAEGSLTGSVKNVPGSLLPSTGGIGTTIFYVVGGTMAAGAGVYLISKKRMKKDEE